MWKIKFKKKDLFNNISKIAIDFKILIQIKQNIAKMLYEVPMKRFQKVFFFSEIEYNWSV